MGDCFSEYSCFLKEEPFDLAANSSIGCGGKAKIAFFPRNVEEFVALLRKLEEDRLQYRVVGNMTNVLPSDEGINGVLISTKKCLECNLGEQNFVSAGIASGRLLQMCRYAGKSGVEFLYGIPCTFGGALFMNAGVSGTYVGDVVESVLVYRDKKCVWLSVKDCQYAYKHSVFMKDNDVILGARLCLTDATVQEIDKRLRFFNERRAHLPQGKSMGCVFKNPKGEYAGRLLETAGVCGLKKGDAYVSEKHANFIINGGKAKSADVQELIGEMKRAVLKQHGVLLEEEIRYLT